MDAESFPASAPRTDPRVPPSLAPLLTIPLVGRQNELGKIEAAFRKAVLARPWILNKVDVLGEPVNAAIAEGAADLPEKLKGMTGARAADAAKKAIASGKPDQVARAIALCDTAKAMGTAPSGPCDGVRSIAPK